MHTMHQRLSVLAALVILPSVRQTAAAATRSFLCYYRHLRKTLALLRKSPWCVPL